MELQKIIGFLAVARYGNFSEAARKTFRTQPAISQQVRQLEEELGVILVERLGNRVSLTAEGKQFAELASPCIEQCQTLQQRFDDLRNQTSDYQVVLATHSSVMESILPTAIKVFRKRYPTANVTMLSRKAGETMQMVINGDVDFGVASLQNPPPQLTYEILDRYKRWLVCPKNHSLAKRKPTLKDISNSRLIIPGAGNTRSVIDAVFKAAKLDYQISLEIEAGEALKEYVELGLGVSILNDYHLSPRDRKRFAIRDVTHIFGEAERAVITRRGRYLNKAALGLIDLIRQSVTSR